MSENRILPVANDNAADDLVMPFSLESSALRGRVVRLGAVLQDILSRHDYVDPVSEVLAQSMTASLLFSAMIKYDGIFTLQLQGDGPVDLVVSDVTSNGQLRGYAKLARPLPEDDNIDVGMLLGKGYIAFTVDQGGEQDRYQGIVPLEGKDFAAICRGYFLQSEQIQTSFRFAAKKVDGVWRAGGVMLQKLPEEGLTPAQQAQVTEDWERADILLQSVKDDELIDPLMSVESLLIRLFHEEGVRVFEPQEITRGCRCTDEKLAGVLASLSPEDRADCAENGKITMTCEFCSKDWQFDA